MNEKRSIQVIIRERREEILRIAAKYGAKNVRIFGSVARGDATPASDVDFLVELEEGRSLMDRAGLLLELEQLLEINVDVATEKSLKGRILHRVLREAVPI